MNKIEHIRNILNSFEKLTGRVLIERTSPYKDFMNIETGAFVLVSHNELKKPVLNYGNHFALGLWEMSWEDFVKTPSSRTAEVYFREKRSAMLEVVSKQGYFENYEGIRISSTGKRFKIKNATIWNVNNDKGKFIGQAAYFESVEHVK